MLEVLGENIDVKQNKLSNLMKLNSYLKPYSMMLVGVVISLILTSTSVLMISQAVRMFIDAGISQRNPSELDEALGFLLTTIFVLALFTFCRFFLISLVGERVVSDMRMDIFRHILRLSPSFFEKNKSGELMSRLTADTTILLTIIGSSFSVALRNAVMLIGGVVVLISTSPKLSLFLLILIPMIVGPIMLLGTRLRIYSRNSQDRVAGLAGQASQVLDGLKVVQAYRREAYETKRFDKMLKEQLKFAFDRIMLRSFLTVVVISLAFGGIGVVLWVGGHQVLTGSISPGELSAFVYVAIVCAGAVAALSDVVGDMQKAVGATERIFEFLAIEGDVTNPKDPKPLPKNAKGKITFENVDFTYDKSKKRKILNDVNFEILPGTVNALVGKSGAGKTTIFMLLERFYNVDSGRILFDGIDAQSLHLSDLRSQFTYVPQEAVIFAATLYENILYGNTDATKAQVHKAAEQAGCMEFIEKLPEGFDTFLGDKGMKLSGGQKQRISIARAMLNNPKILLLDEATSSLDSENEKLVQDALDKLMEGRTTIVIAHRLSTVRNADKIIVIDQGKIVEEGKHSSLIKKKGVYSRLAKMQFS